MLEIKDYFCPKENCKHYGLRDMANLVKVGKYTKKGSGEKRQMLKCKVCGYRFSETHGTLFAGSHYSDKTISDIICCIAEGNGIRATARMLSISKDRVNTIVLKAGSHADRMLGSLLCSLHLNDCQLDELWSFVRKKKLLTRKNSRRNMDKPGYGQP
jgi:transposase-like protein